MAKIEEQNNKRQEFRRKVVYGASDEKETTVRVQFKCIWFRREDRISQLECPSSGPIKNDKRQRKFKTRPSSRQSPS